MKILASTLVLTLVSATAAHAGEVFHRSHEAGLSIYRGAPVVHTPNPASAYESQLAAQQSEDRQVRLQARQLDILQKRAKAEARYLRHLERRDTAWLRGNAAHYPRGYRNTSNFGIILNDGPRRTRRTPDRAGH